MMGRMRGWNALGAVAMVVIAEALVVMLARGGRGPQA
jgi:hypothetical protein